MVVGIILWVIIVMIECVVFFVDDSYDNDDIFDIWMDVIDDNFIFGCQLMVIDLS